MPFHKLCAAILGALLALLLVEGAPVSAADKGGAKVAGAIAAKPSDPAPGKPDFLPIPGTEAATGAAPFMGVYVGAGGGYGLTGLETTVFDCPHFVCVNGTEDGRLAQGWRGDGRLGLDYQAGSLVFGILGGYGYGDSKFTDTMSYGPVSVSLTPMWYVGGRIGIASTKTLWYAGAAWAHAEIEANGPGPFSRDIEGVKAIAGVETLIAPQISLALEGGYTWYEAVSNQVDGAAGVRYEPRDAEVMLRLNWRPMSK